MIRIIALDISVCRARGLTYPSFLYTWRTADKVARIMTIITVKILSLIKFFSNFAPIISVLENHFCKG